MKIIRILFFHITSWILFVFSEFQNKFLLQCIWYIRKFILKRFLYESSNSFFNIDQFKLNPLAFHLWYAILYFNSSLNMFKEKAGMSVFLSFWLTFLHIYYNSFSGYSHFCFFVGSQLCWIWIYFMICGSGVLRTIRTHTELCHPLRDFQHAPRGWLHGVLHGA